MEPEVSIEPLTDELSNGIINQCKCVPALPLTHNKVHPSGMNLPIAYGKHIRTIMDMDVREDDTWVISFPRCGTTWTQEMVWLLKNNLDFKMAKSIYQSDRYKFIEFDAMFDLSPNISEDIANLQPPRFFKSHLHKLLLPKQLWTKKPKIVFVFRNPKDSALSWCHHYRLWNKYTGSLDLFLKAFINDKLMFTPFWDSVLEFWKMRNEPNILFLTYEEMTNDLESVVSRTSEFFGVEYSKEEIAQLLDYLSFSSMKKNESVNMDRVLDAFGITQGNDCFIRKGESGGWKKVFSPEMVKMFDEWTSKNLEGTDFPRDNL